MNETLLRDILTELEEFEQRLWDELRDWKALGREDRELATLVWLRDLKRTIRRTRRVLLEVVLC